MTKQGMGDMTDYVVDLSDAEILWLLRGGVLKGAGFRIRADHDVPKFRERCECGSVWMSDACCSRPKEREIGAMPSRASLPWDHLTEHEGTSILSRLDEQRAVLIEIRKAIEEYPQMPTRPDPPGDPICGQRYSHYGTIIPPLTCDAQPGHVGGHSTNASGVIHTWPANASDD